jgi:hypothetical protein
LKLIIKKITKPKTMTSLQFHSRAYHKAVLHAVKYPQYAINGLFTGYEQDGVIHITDAFPLFHSQITLTPLWEAALMQINSLLKLRNEENGQNKERVIGYYFANEHLDNKEMDQFIVQKILPQIGASQAIVFMVCRSLFLKFAFYASVLHGLC